MKIVIIIKIILILLLISNKDNHRYHNSFNLAAHSSEEIFEGAPGDRVLSVPPVVNQRSIRMSMRVMIRVRSINKCRHPQIICDRKDYENIVLTMMVAPTGAEPQRWRAVRSSLEVARTVPVMWCKNDMLTKMTMWCKNDQVDENDCQSRSNLRYIPGGISVWPKRKAADWNTCEIPGCKSGW